VSGAAHKLSRLRGGTAGIPSLRKAGAVNWTREGKRFVKFLIVGTIGAVVDFGTFNILTAVFRLPPVPSSVASFLAAVTSNFLFNRYWTYPDSRSHPIQQQLVQFFIVNAAGLVFRLIWVRMLFGPLGEVGTNTFAWLGVIESMDDAATKQLGTNIAQFFAIWIVMIWNFFVNRYWTYNDVE
jgi:putative flippase GtrA